MNTADTELSEYGRFFFETQHIKFYHTINGERQRIFKDEIFYEHGCKTRAEALEMFKDNYQLSREEIEFFNSIGGNAVE